jgi:hypothetical protein
MDRWMLSRWIPWAIAALVVVGAMSWALMIPGEKCASGFDNTACVDNSDIKSTVALAGIAIALVVLGTGSVIRRAQAARRRTF